jgi:diguanylate cyclase
MKHSDDVSKAIELLKRTLPEKNRRNIASTPNNYAIWYEYVTGENKQLVTAIQELDKTNTLYSTEILQSLYNQFISDAHEAAVNQLSKSVREIIHDFLSKVNKEGQDLNQYAQTLASVSDRVENINHIDDIKELIQLLLSETRKREEATHNMQSMLENMSLEMRKLRAEVAKLNSEATTDSLTRVNNRRAFDIEIEGLVSLSKSETKPLCLVLADIDHFKGFNEKFGESIGDKVLRFVASLIKNNIKGNDSVARFGGEQFAILLPETKLEGALSVAENIREKLAKQTLSDSAAKIELGTITASFGVTCYQTGDSSDDLINKANIALRDAKKSGRNKVASNTEKQALSDKVHRVIL